MEGRFNPLDPLGILGGVKKDVDRIGSSVISLPLPGPPGMARRSEQERAERHQAAYGTEPPPRGTGFLRLLDPLNLTGKKAGIGNPIPAEFNGKLVDTRDEARRRLIAAGYSETAVGKALNWYDEWLMGMVRMLAPDDMNMQRTLVQKAYSEIAPRAERWIRGIQDAFGVAAA